LQASLRFSLSSDLEGGITGDILIQVEKIFLLKVIGDFYRE